MVRGLPNKNNEPTVGTTGLTWMFKTLTLEMGMATMGHEPDFSSVVSVVRSNIVTTRPLMSLRWGMM